jgi:hypothetical protein
MFEGLIRYRPKHLFAVYAEAGHIEVLRAHRQWRTWHIEPAEIIPVSPGETIYESLQHINLKPKHKTGSALVLFLTSSFYSVHREHYPSSLQGQLEEALHFDWQENVFHEHDRSLHFFGAAVPVDHHLSVPIFSMPMSTYDKLYQVLGGSLFQTFAVIPSALSYQAFLQSLPAEEEGETLKIVGRMIDPLHMEVHRFYHGAFLDSSVIGKNFHNLRLFQEGLRCLNEGTCRADAQIHLVCTEAEAAKTEQCGDGWRDDGVPLRVHTTSEALVSEWVRHLLQLDHIRTFDVELLLKPWKAPKVVWPILAFILLYSLYAIFQVRSADHFADSSKQLKRQVGQLETQWKPIEALQTRISKFQEDRKTLSEFNKEGYPLMEILTLLTQVTPDDTWLNYLSLRKGQLILRGESKSAIKYLSELSKTEGLTDVKFASPVTRNPNSDQERFNVQLQLDYEKLMKVLETNPALKADEGRAPADTPAEALAGAPAGAPAALSAQPPPAGGVDGLEMEPQELVPEETGEPVLEEPMPEEPVPGEPAQ